MKLEENLIRFLEEAKKIKRFGEENTKDNLFLHIKRLYFVIKSFKYEIKKLELDYNYFLFSTFTKIKKSI